MHSFSLCQQQDFGHVGFLFHSKKEFFFFFFLIGKGENFQ